MAKVIDLNETNFESVINESTNPIVVDFWATWCGPCRKLAPLFESISEEYENQVTFAKVNIEECVDIAKKYSIVGLPTVLLFNNGEPVERMTGSIPKSTIVANIDKYI